MAGSDDLQVVEVLLEPGGHQLWVTLDVESGMVTHLLDLAPLLSTSLATSPLRLPRVWRSVTVAPDAAGLRWPGCTLPWTLLSQHSRRQLPMTERYRPLVAYLRGHEPPLWTMPPVTPQRLQSLLNASSHQLEQAAQYLHVDPKLAYQRLHDVVFSLHAYVGDAALPALLRRSSPIAQRLSDIRLHSLQDCLLKGRPDIVERQIILLMLEGAV